MNISGQGGRAHLGMVGQGNQSQLLPYPECGSGVFRDNEGDSVVGAGFPFSVEVGWRRDGSV